MKCLFTIILLFYTILCYAQPEPQDKMELKDGKILVGSVLKVKTDAIEFKESETGLVYETLKSEVKYIQLSTGKILTFEDYKAPLKGIEQNEQQTAPGTKYVEQDSGGNVGLTILASVGAVLILLLIIGAAAQ